MDHARRYATSVGVAGLAVAGVAATRLDPPVLPLLGLFVVAFAVSGLFPMVVHTGAERLHHGFEVTFVVAAVATLPAAAVVVAVAAGHLLFRAGLPFVHPGERGSLAPVKLVFNTGKVAVAAATALAVTAPLPAASTSPTTRLLVAAAAGAAFEAADHLLLRGLRRQLPDGAVPLPARGDLVPSAIVIAGGTVLAAALTAPVHPAVPTGLTLAIVVPLSHVLRGAERGRRQLEVTLRLLDADERSAADVEARLVEAATTVTNAGHGRLGHAPPEDGELGVELVVAGRPRWLTVADRRGSIGAFTDTEAELLRSVATIGSISLARAHRLADTERRAERCELTGLANRSGIRTRFAEASQRRPGQPVALLFLDLDGFKRVNDTHGHDAGDRLLVEVARRLERCVRDRDAVGRWAGDEFVVLLTDEQAARRADSLASRIDVALREPFAAAGGLPVSVSIGASTTVAGAEELSTLVARADQRMYAAKAARGSSPPGTN
jgi:diguanylate cyclase (GGDEF)-like protein